jgi:CBS domain-containing protein
MPTIHVAEVMTREVFAVAPGTSLETVARLLSQKRIHGAPVVDADGTVIGVVSLADLVDPDRDSGHEMGHSIYYSFSDGWAAVMGGSVDTRPGCVDEVMTRAVLTIDASASIEDAAARMIEFGVHRLLVLEGEQMAGVLSVVDLVRGFLLQTRETPAPHSDAS